MQNSQKDAIRKCRVKIVQDLIIEQTWDNLISSGIFTALMLEKIESEKSRAEKVRALLDYLPKRGPKAFHQFLDCLHKSGHSFLANILIATELQIRGEHVPESLQEAISERLYQENMHQVHTVVGQYPYPQPETCQGSEDIEMKPRFEKTGTQPTSMSTIQSLGKGIQCSEGAGPSIQNSSMFSQQSSSNHSGYTGNFIEEYKMESVPRGYLFIINNRDFNGDSFSDRHGTDKDCAGLKELFLRLGFGVDVRHNLTVQEIKDQLQELSQLADLEHVDCLAVAILTHGQEDRIYGVDGQYIMTQDVFRPFTASQCPRLHHKPKLFIINACRKGDQCNPDCENTDGCCDTCTSRVSADTEIVPSLTTSPLHIPDQQDFLLAYSTTPNDVSWRHIEEGSWFIQSIVDVFRNHASNSHVSDMLIKVNRLVSQKFSRQGCIQIPAPQVMLTHSWFLNPINRTPFEVKPDCVPV